MIKVNVLIIGCGKIAGENYSKDLPYSCHAKSYSHSKKVNRIYYFDIEKEKAMLLSKVFPGTVVHSLEELSNISIDIVSICTPYEEHYSAITDTIKFLKPKLFFVEKPICKTKEEYLDLEKLHLKVPIIVNHSRRFDINSEKLSQVIKSGEYGQIIEVRAIYYGGFSNLCIHIIDQLYSLGLEQFKNIKIAKNHYSKRHSEHSFDIKCFAGEVPVSLNSFSEDHFQVSEIDLFLKNGRIKIENFGRDITYYSVQTNINDERELFFESKIESKTCLLDTAINKIIESCISKDLSQLEKYNITSTLSTMNTIWSISNHGSN